MANGNPFLVPLRYKYQPVNYTAYAEPLMHHQQQYDKTLSALDETTYDIAHMTQDKELAKKMEEGLQGDLDKVSKDLLANADYKGAARKLSKLNKFYNNDDHMNAVRNSYANEQTLLKELNEGIANEDWDEKYKQERLALERANFKGTAFNEGSYNIFNPGANYKDYTDEIKDEVEALLAKNPTEVREYLTKGRKLNAYQTRMMEEKIEQNDFQGLYDIAISTVTGNPKYAASIGHRAGLHYDYLGLNNPEWAAEKYGKDLAQFDEAIANAKNEEDRTTLRDNKAILQQKYEESQGDYYKSLYAQQMVDNMVRPIAANFTEYKQTLGSGFTYDNNPFKKWTDKEKAKQQVKKATDTNVISIYGDEKNKVITKDIYSNAFKNNAGLGVNAKQDIVGKFSGLDATIKESKVAVTTLAGDITSSQTELRNKQNAYGANPTDEQKEELAQLQNTVNKQTTDYQNLSGQLATSSDKLNNIKQQAIATLKETYPAEAAKYEKMSNEEFIAALSKDYGTSEVGGASAGDVIENIAGGIAQTLPFVGQSETMARMSLDLQEYAKDEEEITSDAINLLGTTFNNLYTEAQLDETMLISTNTLDYNGVKELSPQIEAAANYIDNVDEGDLSDNVYVTEIDNDGNYKTATDIEGNPIDLTSINLGSMKPVSYGGNQTVSGEKGLEKDGFILNYAYDEKIDPKLANAFIYNQINKGEIDADFGDAKKRMFDDDGNVRNEYATAYNKFYENNANKTFPLLVTGTSTNTQEIPTRLLQDYKITQNPEILERYAESVALEFPQLRENYRNLAYEIRETLKSDNSIAATPKIIKGIGNEKISPSYKISMTDEGIKQVEYILQDNDTEESINMGIINMNFNDKTPADLLLLDINSKSDPIYSLY